jgi:hypothetical protein
MLSTLDGNHITTVPHAKSFQSALRQLGNTRAEEVRRGLNAIIDELPPDKERGTRTFSSSFLGSELSPWPHPIAHLYDVAREMAGAAADEEYVQEQAALLFGLFVWECIMNRDEAWVFYDPNLNSRDPNREITGKVYFERNE